MSGCLLFQVSSESDRNDIDSAAFTIKHDVSVNQCVKRVIVALTNTRSCMEFGADLTDDDVSCSDDFAAKLLDATALGVGVSTVAARSLSLLMCHFRLPDIDYFEKLLGFAAI